MEIHFHLTDGSIAKFDQPDPVKALHIVSHIQLNKIFQQNTFLLGTDVSATAYPCSSVVRIDFLTESYPDWPFSYGASDVMEVTQEEFQERYDPAEVIRDPLLLFNRRMVTYAEFEMVNGERLMLEIHTLIEPATPMDMGRFIHQIFASPVIHARRRGGGVILLNPGHIVNLTFVPGPPEMPAYAWAAQRIVS